MKGLIKHRVTVCVLIAFTFFTFSDGYPQSNSIEKKGLKLIREGEELFKINACEEALQKFLAAQKLVKTKKNHLRLYKNLSYLYYSLGREKEAKETIKKLLEIDLNFKKLDETAYAFRELFSDIQERLKRIEVPGVKKKKFPWLLVAGGAVVAVLVYFLLIKRIPKYTLMVTKGEGIDGYPESGTYTYKKGAHSEL